MLDQRRAHVDSARAGDAARVSVALDPAFIDGRGFRTAVSAVKEDDIAGEAMRLEKTLQVVLCAAGLREDQRFASCADDGNVAILSLVTTSSGSPG